MAKELTRSYQGPDTETQTYCLRTITFGLQRAAGPYRRCQFGYRKVRYRGIAKNGAQVFSLLALANLYLARRTFVSA
jgi:IS5 family transposase